MKICPLQKPLGSHLCNPISLINLLQALWWLPISLASYPSTLSGRVRVVQVCRRWSSFLLPLRVLHHPQFSYLPVHRLTQETEHGVPSSGPYCKDRLSCEIPQEGLSAASSEHIRKLMQFWDWGIFIFLQCAPLRVDGALFANHPAELKRIFRALALKRTPCCAEANEQMAPPWLCQTQFP